MKQKLAKHSSLLYSSTPLLLIWFKCDPNMDCTHYKVWDDITCPFPHFNRFIFEVWDWRSIFIRHNLCVSMLRLKLIHVNKRDPSAKKRKRNLCCLQFCFCNLCMIKPYRLHKNTMHINLIYNVNWDYINKLLIYIHHCISCGNDGISVHYFKKYCYMYTRTCLLLSRPTSDLSYI